jgi:hypothetical protein
MTHIDIFVLLGNYWIRAMTICVLIETYVETDTLGVCEKSAAAKLSRSHSHPVVTGSLCLSSVASFLCCDQVDKELLSYN